MSESCNSCKFWMVYSGITSFGLCRCGPPQRDNDDSGRWPETKHDDWCGAYEPEKEQP